MTKRQRTEKSKYKHESTGDYCTCAAYIAEIMCQRNAENQNVGSLPYKFWNTKRWSWTFKRQLFAANKLIKEFGEQVVVRAINSPEFGKIFSLNHSKTRDVILKHKTIIEDENSKPKQEIERVEEPTIRRSSFGSKNILSKLRDIDGKKEV